MRVLIGAMAAWLLLGNPVVAQDTVANEKKADAKAAAQQDEAQDDLDSLSEEQAAKRVKELTEGFDKAMVDFRQKFMAASDEEKAKLRGEAPSVPKNSEMLMKLAERFPKSEFAADALLWVASRQRGPVAEKAIDQLLANHVTDPKLGQVVMSLASQRPSAEAEKRFKLILENDQVSDEVAGLARYAFLQYAKSVAQLKEVIENNKDRAEAIARAYGEPTIEYAKNFVQLDEDAYLAALEKLVERYGKVEIRPGLTLGSIAEGEIFEAKYLKIGKVAPDIEGEDVDGVEFKLSDYRGKIVVLDFWGDW